MKILLLVGSGDTKSHTLTLGREVEASLQELGAETELINLIEYGLPLYDRSVERADEYDDKTRALLNKSYEADAFIWLTPIYHNSFSSVLKNALDWQHTKFPGKVVGLASNGGDRSPQAVDQLTLVARAQHLVSGRIRVCTDSSDYNENYDLADEGIKSRIKDFAAEIVHLTKRIGQ